MSEVKRYTESCMEGGGVAPDYSGEFVECKDYEKLRAELAAIKAGQGEAITEVSAETFSSDGTSEIITCNLPIGTKLYLSAPPASADAVSVAPGLERAIQIVREVAKTQPGYSDEREAIFEALSEAYAEAKAPAPADAVSVPVELLHAAARLLKSYQEVIDNCHSSELERFDYQPEVQGAADELRALLAQQGKENDQ